MNENLAWTCEERNLNIKWFLHAELQSCNSTVCAKSPSALLMDLVCLLSFLSSFKGITLVVLNTTLCMHYLKKHFYGNKLKLKLHCSWNANKQCNINYLDIRDRIQLILVTAKNMFDWIVILNRVCKKNLMATDLINSLR